MFSSKSLIFRLAVLCLLFALQACNEGLIPTGSLPLTERKSVLYGTIRFVGGKAGWVNAQDSVLAIRIAAFKNFPPEDIVGDVLAGRAYVTFESLPFTGPDFAKDSIIGLDSVRYALEIPDAPVELQYIAVAQQYGADFFTKQRVIGVYTVSGQNTEPSAVTVSKGDSVRADITVDFLNLPPQPFE